MNNTEKMFMFCSLLVIGLFILIYVLIENGYIIYINKYLYNKFILFSLMLIFFVIIMIFSCYKIVIGGSIRRITYTIIFVSLFTGILYLFMNYHLIMENAYEKITVVNSGIECLSLTDSIRHYKKLFWFLYRIVS